MSQAVERILYPKPVAIKQPNRATCWAAALASFLRTTRPYKQPMPGIGPTAADIPEGWDLQPDLTVSAIITRVKQLEQETGMSFLRGADNGLSFNLFNTAWRDVLNAYGITPMTTYSSDQTPLTLEKIISLIDQTCYVILCYLNPAWTDRNGYNLHVMIIYGYNRESESVWVMDPASATYYTFGLAPDYSSWIAAGKRQSD